MKAVLLLSTLLEKKKNFEANSCFAWSWWSMSFKFLSLKHASSMKSFIDPYNLSVVMPSMELYMSDITAATDLEDFFMADFRSASFLYLSAPVSFVHSSSNCIRNHLDLSLQTKEFLPLTFGLWYLYNLTMTKKIKYMYFEGLFYCGCLKVIMQG